jgi:hypothetical protein
MMIKEERELFERQGYITLESLLPADACAGLFKQVLQSHHDSIRSYVLAGSLRAHCPLRLSPLVKRVLRSVIESRYDVIAQCLHRHKWLVELSSITVFPGAACQPIHVDEEDPDKAIVTVFINLFATEERVGPLCVFPGSHRRPPEAGAAPRTLLLPPGSAVIMNSKVWHAGTENISADRIRPVVYFSFGDDDIAGPTYSLRSEYRRKFTLAHFQRPPLDGDCRPRIARNRAVAIGLAQADGSRQIFCLEGERVDDWIEVGKGEAWVVRLLDCVGHGSGETSAVDLARRLRISVGEMLQTLRKLDDAGVIEW